MPSIRATLNQFTSSVSMHAGDALATITNAFNGIVGQAQAAIGSLIPGSVVGINVNRIPEMKAAIQKEINDIENHLAEVHTNTDPSVAFADPEMQAACRAYIEGVMEACRAYTSQLGKFIDLLTDIQNSYVTAEAERAATLKQAGGEMASSVERYTVQSN